MRSLLALSAAMLIASCASVDRSQAPSFGRSVEAMDAAQVSDAPVADEAPEGSGATGAAAQRRYQSGQTRALLPATTSTANPSSN